MKITINTDICAATGNCVRVAPDVFDLSGGVLSLLRDEPTDSATRELVIEAMDTCPTGAISVDDETI